MRILLVNPPAGELAMGLRDIACVEPLGLEIIGASVPEHTVEILDMQLDSDLHGKLREFRPDVVGITGGIVQTYNARRVAERAKAFDPAIRTVIGGHHATLCPHDFDSASVDVIVLGEGVAPFRELVQRFENGDTFTDVLGLAIPGPGGLAFTPPRPQPRNLDHQPLPDRSLTAQYRDRYFYIHESPVALVQTSMGCTFPCTFCSCRVFTERRFIPRSVEAIADDLENLDEDFVIFCDDHSFLRADRMHALADILEKRGIRKRYFAYSRLDCVIDHPDLFRRWADLGLEIVMAGVEAVDAEQLKSLDKRTDVAKNDLAIDILAGFGVGVSAGFVIMPDFDEQDFRRIDEYVSARPSIVMSELTPFTPLPGTQLHREVFDTLLTTDRELFDLFHFVVPTTLPQDEMYGLLRQYYFRIMLRMFVRLKMYRPSVLKRRHIPQLLAGLVAGVARLEEAHKSVRRPD